MRALVGSMVGAVTLALASTPAMAAPPLEIDAEIGGRDIQTADSSRPIRIDPEEQIPLRLTIRNTTDHTEEIRYVRLEGKALGLTFLTYDLGVRATLPPGEATTIETDLDFFDLDKQATGYLGTSLRVYDAERNLLAEEAFVVDVRGNVTSTLGLFAILVVGVAVFSVTVLVANTIRRRLPLNRFVRGLQFAVGGAAVGITLALGFSILRVAFAEVEAWAPLVFLPTVIAFGLGYLAPGPLSQSIRAVREEEALQAAAEEAVVRASGGRAPFASDLPTRGQRSGEHAAVSHSSVRQDVAVDDGEPGDAT